MRFDEMSAEQKAQLREKAQKCETSEERMAFLAESGIELSDEQLKGISGGGVSLPDFRVCPKSKSKDHVWVFTGRTRPGSIFGDWWPDKEEQCKFCGVTRWVNF